MDIYKFSLNDLKTARYIIANQGADRYGSPLYPASFETWAKKVIKWFDRFYQVLRAYAKLMKSAALAIKAIWKNINRGLSLPAMLKLLIQPRAAGFQGRKWQRNRGAHRITPINPRTNKHAFRMRNKTIAHNLQTPNLCI